MDNMLSLSENSATSLAQNRDNFNQELVTTRELAEVLGVSVDTVTRVAGKVLDPSAILRRVINGGESKVFNEKQATLIKQEIQGHHNLASRQIDNVATDYEMELMTQKVIQYHIGKAAEYKRRAEVAESALNRIANGKGCFGMNQTAKALKLPYGDKTLYKVLIEQGILNQDKSPRQEQANAGRFKVVIKHINDFVGNKPVTLTTGKGLVYLAKKFNTEIDESILPDAM